MKKVIERIISLVLALLMVMTWPAVINADYCPNNGWMNFAYGGYVYIPKSFSNTVFQTYPESGTRCYKYYNSVQQMEIQLFEESSSHYSIPVSSIINSEYERYRRSLPEAVYKAKLTDSFTLSGYSEGGKRIYYLSCTLANNSVYTVYFEYPTSNRRVCDPIVEEVIGSFSTRGSRPAGALKIKPSSADFDRIHADIKYPNYSWMYLDSYVTATVTHEAVYCFKDPDNNSDIWRDGNYFTVYYGTEVTILAQSKGYACVILNGSNRAGWINMKYLSIMR